MNDRTVKIAMEPKTVKDIIKKYIDGHPVAMGLCYVGAGEECGCSIEDLMPCGSPEYDCELAVDGGKDSDVDQLMRPLYE